MQFNGKVGLELEFLLLDEAGQVVNSADHLLKHCRSKRTKHYVKGECSKCQIEIIATPKNTVKNMAESVLKTMRAVQEEARKLDLWLYPLASYPGEMLPKIRNKPWYRMQQKVVGVTRWSRVVGSISGFHFHSDLPRGVMDWDKRKLKEKVRPAQAKTLINQYNFLIAADPAICCIMQSSPFFQGEFYCKDTRIALWRNLDLPDIGVAGLYADMQTFARLPYYAQTVYDIDFVLQNSKRRWMKKLEEKDPGLVELVEDAHPMRFYWGPLRVNKIGTLEQRGMDMNLLRNVFGVSSLLQSCLYAIEDNDITLVPSEVGIKTPFKIEGDVMYVPPRSYVAHDLTRKCITHGLADKEVSRYCRRLLEFSSNYISSRPDISLNSVKKIIVKRHTVSDDMMRRLGVKDTDIGFPVEQDDAGELALKYAEEFEDDISNLLTHYLLLDFLTSEGH